MQNSDLSLKEIIKWPLNYSKKIVLSVKNTNQINAILNLRI